MNTYVFFWTIFLCLLPIAELRGAIPFALWNKIYQMNVFAAFFLCVFVNSLVGPIVYVFLSTLHKLLSHMKWYQRIFDRLIERARVKVKAVVDKYGFWGLAIFVGIPLPMTGAYTGALGAWVLGMKPWKAFLAIAVGVLMAGIVVTIVAFFGIKALSFFIKT
jgi:uncharacterized membrane protein